MGFPAFEDDPAPRMRADPVNVILLIMVMDVRGPTQVIYTGRVARIHRHLSQRLASRLSDGVRMATPWRARPRLRLPWPEQPISALLLPTVPRELPAAAIQSLA